MAKQRMKAKGKQSLSHAYPELAKEWHPTKNHRLKPINISSDNNQKVWWRCSNGHDWEGRVYARVMGLQCPTCQQEAKKPQQSETSILPQPTQPSDELVNLMAQPSTNILPEQFPQLHEEWLQEKNEGKPLNEFSIRSNFKAWWKCSTCENEWQTLIKLRASGSGCPKCSQRQKYVKVGENDLATLHPETVPYWHPTKNAKLTPAHFIATSQLDVWWAKPCGHEYKRSITEEVTEQNCLVCESFAMKHPDLVKEWNYRSNKGLDPYTLPMSHHKKVGWRCQKGHEFQATIKHRLAHPTCPICQEIQTGKLDANHVYPNLQSEFPLLAAQWHPTKNGELTPTTVRPSSNRKVWWRCEHGHEWEESAAYRQRSPKCPFCQSLAFKNPTIAKLWHPTKNESLTPWDVRSGSKKEAWWQCLCGYEWKYEIGKQNHSKSCLSCGQPFETITPQSLLEPSTEENEQIIIVETTSLLEEQVIETPSTVEAIQEQPQLPSTEPSNNAFQLPNSFDLWTFKTTHHTEQSIEYLVFNHRVYQKIENRATELSPTEILNFCSRLFDELYPQLDAPCLLTERYETNKDLLFHLGFELMETFKKGHWEGTEYLKISNEQDAFYLGQHFRTDSAQMTVEPCFSISEDTYLTEKQAYAQQLVDQLRQAGISIELPLT